MLEESYEHPMTYGTGTVYDDFWSKQFSSYKFYKFCHKKSWSGFASGLDPYSAAGLDPNPDSEEYLDPDPKH